MLWTLFFALYGDVILALLGVLSLSFRSSTDSQIDPDDSTFIKNADFMFPENFLSRYPHEANPFRLKIYSYLIFNLLVKGYGSVDPRRFWEDYNHDGYKRTFIDAVFYEYLTNFTDREAKDLVFNPLESPMRILPDDEHLVFGPWKRITRNLSVSNEEIAVDRIGQYLDLLSETKSEQKRLKSAYEILSESNKPPTITEPRTAECEMQIKVPTSGLPGIDYPNFCDIPETSFSCDGKMVPGIYADYETGCQVFHVCWPRRIDSFLCPIGTTFNQSLLTCDIWHATACYSSLPFVDSDQFVTDGISSELDVPNYDGSCESLLNKPLQLHMKFLPAKCEVRYLEDGNQVEITKTREKDEGELVLRLETAYHLVREMLEMLREIRDDLGDEMMSRGTPWIQVLAKRFKSRPATKFNPETADGATEVTRKVGETNFKSLEVAEQVNHSGKLSSGMMPSPYVTHSTLLKPSESLEDHIKSSKKQDTPEIVMKSLRLGGAILNKGISLTKQVIIDSYRKIKAKKH